MSKDEKIHGLILGTFMPFHKGHELLINFGKEYTEQFGRGRLLVILSSRSNEPISGNMRLDAIRKTFGNDVSIFHHIDDDAPQNPKDKDDVKFWEYWKKVITKAAIQSNLNPYAIKYVFSSENYGDKVAEIIDATHVKFDQARTAVHVSGTQIRNNPLSNYQHMNAHMITNLRRRYVLFGAESVGKTTSLKYLGNSHYGSHTLPEYARPFLEELEDKSPSEKNMCSIFMAQHSMEIAAMKQVGGSLLTFMDTDIMSTFGYARLVKMKTNQFEHLVPIDFRRTYFVLSQDEVPFEKDILRYGGDVRETKDSFWINLLEEFNLRYFVVKGDFSSRMDQINAIIAKDFKKDFHFNRE